MDELKEKLASLGVAGDKIEEVIQTVLGFVKDKLPEGVSGMFDNLVGGDGEDGEGGNDLVDKVKGMFGG